MNAEWKWFGHAGHIGNDCRFHLCTLIGDYLISTVGEYLPDETVREIHAKVRGVQLEGRGDSRLASFLMKCGFIEIGYGRKYETMVFKVTGKLCENNECNCGLPIIIPHHFDFKAYNIAGDATQGHYAMCAKWKAGKPADDSLRTR